MTRLLIGKPLLFSFKECCWFLNRNYDDCVLTVSADRITRAISIDGQTIVVTLTEDDKHILVRVDADSLGAGGKEKLIAYVTDWLDLARDLAPFYTLLEKHKALRYMTTAFGGLRLVGMPDLHEALCWGIIGQQINLTFAYKLKRRLVEAYGSTVEAAGIKHHIFPTPAALAVRTIEELKALQFSRQKADYLIYVSKQFVEGGIDKDRLQGMTTAERLTALTALKGVGVWTANYIMMKALKDMNGIPHGDVGLLKALEQHGLIKDRADVEGIGKIFKKFKGWESYLVFYLWRSLAVNGDEPTAI